MSFRKFSSRNFSPVKLVGAGGDGQGRFEGVDGLHIKIGVSESNRQLRRQLNGGSVATAGFVSDSEEGGDCSCHLCETFTGQL